MEDIKDIINFAAQIIRLGPPPPAPKTDAPKPKILTLPQAAKALGCCELTLRRAIWRKDLVALRAGREIRIKIEDLRAYLRRKVEFSYGKAEMFSSSSLAGGID